MTPELKQKWIEKLRSGDIVQCVCTYARGAERCALGVLRDLDPTAERAMNKRKRHEVVWMNDHEGKTFHQIADWIENNVDA